MEITVRLVQRRKAKSDHFIVTVKHGGKVEKYKTLSLGRDALLYTSSIRYIMNIIADQLEREHDRKQER